jgi:hypothetical protein
MLRKHSVIWTMRPPPSRLGQIARDEPAFRWHAIAALSAMDHISAHEELSQLMHVNSAETRYAAFVALRSGNRWIQLSGGKCWVISSTCMWSTAADRPMIHLSRSRRAEIVLFGQPMELDSPAFLYAGKQIMLKADGPERIRVMRFAAREEDREVSCGPSVDEVIHKIVEVGGTYSDVVQFLQEAKSKDYVDARLVVDALPSWGREYRRSSREDGGLDDQPERSVATPCRTCSITTRRSPLGRGIPRMRCCLTSSHRTPRTPKGVGGTVWATGLPAADVLCLPGTGSTVLCRNNPLNPTVAPA